MLLIEIPQKIKWILFSPLLPPFMRFEFIYSDNTLINSALLVKNIVFFNYY